MVRKITLSLLAGSFLGLFLILSTKSAQAQSCGGTITCGSRTVEVCTDTSGNNCRCGDIGCINSREDCQGTTTTTSCGSYSPPAACEGQGICQVYIGVCIKSGRCEYTPPAAVCGNGIAETGEACGEPGRACAAGYYCSACRCYPDSGPDPTDPPPPPPSGCTSGWCIKYSDYPAMTDCASVVKVPGSGSCDGGICCSDGPGGDPPSCEGDAWDVPPRTEGDRGAYLDNYGGLTWTVGTSRIVRVKIIYDPPEATVRACLRTVTLTGTDPIFLINGGSSYCQNDYNIDGEYHMNVRLTAVNIGTARLEPNGWVETGGGRAGCFEHNRNFTINPACTLTVDPVAPKIGETLIGFANATNLTMPIASMQFVSVNPLVATVTSPGTQVSPTSFFTNVTGVGVGTANYRARALNSSGILMCTDRASVTVTDVPDWWQTVEGDVIAKTGDVEGQIPSGFLLNEKVDPKSPGVVIYGGNNLDTGSGIVSSTNWSVKGVHNYEQYNYQFFKNHLPTSGVTTIASNFDVNSFNTTGSVDADGYAWYYYPAGSGPLHITGTGSIGRKVVLIAEDDVSIETNITLNDNTNHFLMIVSANNIFVNPAVGNGISPALEGIFYAQNSFATTDSAGTIANQRLVVQGTVVAGGLNLARELSGVQGTTTPAEQFVYDPNILLNYPKQFSPTRVVWKEVAP